MKKIVSFLLALLLTGSLILSCAALLFRFVVAPGLGEEGARVSDAVIWQQAELVRARINDLAELYGFSPEPAAAAVTDETLRNLNAQASLWWKSVLEDGTPGDPLFWNTEELEMILEEDPLLGALPDREKASALAAEAAGQIRESVLRVVLPLRQAVVRLGMQKAGKRVDIPNLVSFLLGTPWALLALALMLSGLVFLINYRQLHAVLAWLGSSLGAAGLVLILLAALALGSGVGAMIREASGGLTILADSETNAAMLRAFLLAAVMIAGCAACLVFSGRDRKKDGA